MALPPKPTVTATTATVTESVAPAAPVAAATDSKVKMLKKFGAARTGEGDSSVLVPTPKLGGIDGVELSKQFYNTLVNFAAQANVKLDDVIAFCADADKSQFPGHKDGRIAYATAGTIASLAKINGLLNKVRGVGGGAAMKAKIAEKDSKIAMLEAKLAELMAALGK